MSQSFFDQPVLNSPYAVPTRHHALNDDGQPLDQPPVGGRRPCDFITPVPRPKRRKAAQASMVFGDTAGLTGADQEYNPRPIINEIRAHVAVERAVADTGYADLPCRFAVAEWRHVVDAWNLADLDSYATVPRIGRRGGARRRAPIMCRSRASRLLAGSCRWGGGRGRALECWPGVAGAV